MTIGEKEAFYLLFNDVYQIGIDNWMKEAYEKYKNPNDSFLYIIYSSELVWGKNKKKKRKFIQIIPKNFALL